MSTLSLAPAFSTSTAFPAARARSAMRLTRRRLGDAEDGVALGDRLVQPGHPVPADLAAGGGVVAQEVEVVDGGDAGGALGRERQGGGRVRDLDRPRQTLE